MHTFIYHIFLLISNILVFTLHPRIHESFMFTNICITAAIGFIVTYILYNFLLFKDKDARLHQELWCGNIMDSSDAEHEREKQHNQILACRKKKSDAQGNEIFACA